MSLFGKILIFFNIVAALVVGWLFIQDYALRQQWAYAVYRQELVLKGLPVTDKEEDKQGNLLFHDLDEKALTDLFKGQNPVRTQKEEVERVRTQYQNKINGTQAVSIVNPLEPDKKLDLQTKLQKLAWAQRPFTVSASRREGLDRLITAGNDDRLDDLKGVFDAKFEEELSKMDPAKRREAITDRLQKDWDDEFQTAERKEDFGEKRRLYARLLFGMVELSVDEESAKAPPDKKAEVSRRDLIGNAAYKRAIVVVGVEQARKELDAESQAMEGMTVAIGAGMANDRDLFYQQHAALVSQLLAAADELQDRRLELAREREKVQAHEESVKVTRIKVKELQDRLEDRQKATRALLDQQAKMEQQLFKQLQEFRDATQMNFELIEEIRKLEKGR